ncbi:MAG: outer membrane beta-barrel protein [Kiritimatiellales bacterium]|nr:outer membrane beta-barrel protein [Kiritimatiellales bacterium]
MYKTKLWVSVLIGLTAGQIFAAGDRPFKVINTVRFGYSDNLYHETADNAEAGTFITDTIDLSFSAAFSDRTDMMVKSQLKLLTDQKENGLYPNLYMMLNHSVSPRLLLSLSEYYRSNEKSGTEANIANGTGTRYAYFVNTVGLSADYVLTQKDRLTASVNHSILRGDKALEANDYTTIGGGVAWRKELSPQRTFASLKLYQSHVNYENQPQADWSTPYSTTNPAVTYTNNFSYLDDQQAYDQTDLSIELSHTFNQNWQGRAEVGVSYIQRDFPDLSSTWTSSTNSTPVNGATNFADNAATINPMLKLGLIYSPSPRTRLTGDFSLTHQESNDNGYGGQDSAELRFGAQHDITAKLMAKATARFANITYDSKDDVTGGATQDTEDRMDLDFRLTYKLNRIHFLEAGVQHREANRDNGNSWSENRVDVGWRVELN